MIHDLLKQISALQLKVAEIQDQCNHPDACLTKTPKSNTGGYDGPSSDSYWYDCECTLCLKKWREDQ